MAEENSSNMRQLTDHEIPKDWQPSDVAEADIAERCRSIAKAFNLREGGKSDNLTWTGANPVDDGATHDGFILRTNGAYDRKLQKNYSVDELAEAAGIFVPVVTTKSRQMPEFTPPEGAKEYTVGFLFDNHRERVLLVLKSHPEWQHGRLNGIGGKCEPNETADACMIREFQEETGLNIFTWRRFAVLSGNDALYVHNGGTFSIHFYRAFADGEMLLPFASRAHASATPGEWIISCNAGEPNPAMLPNLSWLIPMALSPELENVACFHVVEQQYGTHIEFASLPPQVPRTSALEAAVLSLLAQHNGEICECSAHEIYAEYLKQIAHHYNNPNVTSFAAVGYHLESMARSIQDRHGIIVTKHETTTGTRWFISRR